MRAVAVFPLPLTAFEEYMLCDVPLPRGDGLVTRGWV